MKPFHHFTTAPLALATVPLVGFALEVFAERPDVEVPVDFPLDAETAVASLLLLAPLEEIVTFVP